MITSQRLILMFILLNLAIAGVSTLAYSNPLNVQDFRYITTRAEGIEEDLDSDDEYSSVANRDYDSETTAYNSVTWSSTIGYFMLAFVSPLPLSWGMYSSTPLIMFSILLFIIRGGFLFLLYMEMYMIWKNRKTS